MVFCIFLSINFFFFFFNFFFFFLKKKKKKQHRVKLNGQVQGRFDTAELERSIREIVKQNDKAGGENALLKGSETE